MKTFIHSFVVTVIMALCFSACGSEDELIPVADSSTGVMVAKQSDYMVSQSRSFDDRQILVFPDKDSYTQTLEMLKSMSDKERMRYFEEIGFEGAYTMLNRADSELEGIFDNENLDSCQFRNEIYGFIDKYRDCLTFKSEKDISVGEAWDVTPSLNFNDENLEIIGSADGYVVVGGVVIGKSVSRAVNTEPQDLSFHKASEVSINHGNYKSFLAIGSCGIKIAFRVQTYRQKFLHKKYDNRCIHKGYYEIIDKKGVTHVAINHRGGVYTHPDNVPTKKSQIDPYFDWNIVDFHDDYHEDEKLNKIVKNVHFD